MSSMALLQVVFNLVVACVVYILWLRLKKPPQDDPRISRGLQLLQSKISVLEDLSDRTEVQVSQLTALLEQKIKKVQLKIEDAGKQILAIDQSMERSREVAKIFQDKIPHREIIERQNTIKYVKAAKLAHEGRSLAEISQEVDLPIAELEFIAKVNRDDLMFDSNSLPEWARETSIKKADSVNDEGQESGDDFVFKDSAEDFEFRERDMAHAFDVPNTEYSSLRKLGDEFRQACQSFEEKQREGQFDSDSHGIIESARSLTGKLMNRASDLFQSHGIDFQGNSQETENADLKGEQEKQGEQEIGPEIFMPQARKADVAFTAGNTESLKLDDMKVKQSKMEQPSILPIQPEAKHQDRTPTQSVSEKKNEFLLKKEKDPETQSEMTLTLDTQSIKSKEKLIRKVEFPRIDSETNPVSR